MQATQNLLPHWVTPPPIGERIVDALGLSTILDACADNILPGISVLTRRARYWSFFCWARTKTEENITEDIHRLEVLLAKGEHIIHSGDKTKTECSWLGKDKIVAVLEAGPIPLDPRKVTRNPGWLAYRPALVDAKLVEHKHPYHLTKDGKRLAQLYKGAACPPKQRDGKWLHKACLSMVSGDEKNALRGIIGFSKRGSWSCQNEDAWAKRSKTIQALEQRWAGTGDAGAVLIYWRDRRRGLHDHSRLLAESGGWASLAFGMTALLAAWIEGNDRSGRVELVKAIKSTRSLRVDSKTVTIIARKNLKDREATRNAFSAIKCGVDALDRLGCSTNHYVRTWAESLTKNHDPSEILERLEEHHEKLKGPLRWTLPENRAAMPKQIQMSNLRIDSLLSLGRDIGWRPQ